MQTHALDVSIPSSMPRGTTRKLDPLVEASVQFGNNPRPTAEEVKAFKELFFTLIFKADAKAKRKLSTALSRSNYTPRTIAIFFSMEAIETSAPMLLFSPVLRERDLNALITKGTVAHMRVIARRTSLETSTVRKLLSHKDDQDLVSKLLKKNANLSENPEILDLLNLPASAFQTEKPEIAATKPIAAAKDTQEPAQTVVIQKQATLMELANRGGRIASKRQTVQQPYSGSTEQFEKQLLECARMGNFSSFSQSIENVYALEVATTLDIIERRDAGMLASLLRAMQISKTASCQLLLLLNRDVGRNVAVFRAVTQKFDELRRSECKAIFERMGAQFGDSTAATPVSCSHEVSFETALHNRRESVLPNQQHAPELRYGTL